MNVLIIPEDFRKDQYMLKPIIEAMMNSAGRRQAKVKICRDPLLGGYTEAVKVENIRKIITKYVGMIDLFLLCVDRDGVESRQQLLNQREEFASTILPLGRTLFAENAWQEIEVWVLAGYEDLPSEWQWSEIRVERDPKENYFYPFARQKGVLNGPGEGRKALAEDAARRYSRIRQLCPEVRSLETRIRDWLA